MPGAGCRGVLMGSIGGKTDRGVVGCFGAVNWGLGCCIEVLFVQLVYAPVTEYIVSNTRSWLYVPLATHHQQ